jgi:predicted nuclease with TOPRIM domain
MQQENDRLRARRFQLELERGDRLQRTVDLEPENHTLEENADVYETERLTLLQNIADMQQQVEEAEVQVAALQAIVALQPHCLQYRHTRRSSRICLVWIRQAR